MNPVVSKSKMSPTTRVTWTPLEENHPLKDRCTREEAERTSRISNVGEIEKTRDQDPAFRVVELRDDPDLGQLIENQRNEEYGKE